LVEFRRKIEILNNHISPVRNLQLFVGKLQISGPQLFIPRRRWYQLQVVSRTECGPPMKKHIRCEFDESTLIRLKFIVTRHAAKQRQKGTWAWALARGAGD